MCPARSPVLLDACVAFAAGRIATVLRRMLAFLAAARTTLCSGMTRSAAAAGVNVYCGLPLGAARVGGAGLEVIVTTDLRTVHLFPAVVLFTPVVCSPQCCSLERAGCWWAARASRRSCGGQVKSVAVAADQIVGVRRGGEVNVRLVLPSPRIVKDVRHVSNACRGGMRDAGRTFRRLHCLAREA